MKYLQVMTNTLFHAIRVRFFLLKEWIIQFCRYSFLKPRYLFLDIVLVLSYFFKSPYRIVREWDETHDDTIGPYGELPLSEMERIYSLLLKDKEIRIFYDFGSGRGRLTLWAALCMGWTSYAVEIVPLFCKKLDWLIRCFKIRNLHSVLGAYSSISLKACDLVLINPGELEALQEEKMMSALSSLKAGSYILSIGFTLPSSSYEVVGMMPLRCSWGDDYAVLQRKI